MLKKPPKCLPNGKKKENLNKMMTKLTIPKIETFIQELKKGKKLTIAGEYDPDPYGGGANWAYELRYDAERQIFVLQTNFYASQYNTEPEISYLDFNEKEVMERLLFENEHSVSCW